MTGRNPCLPLLRFSMTLAIVGTCAWSGCSKAEKRTDPTTAAASASATTKQPGPLSSGVVGTGASAGMPEGHPESADLPRMDAGQMTAPPHPTMGLPSKASH